MSCVAIGLGPATLKRSIARYGIAPLALPPSLAGFADRVKRSFFVWFFLFEPMAGRIFGNAAGEKRGRLPRVMILLCEDNNAVARKVRRTCNLTIDRKLKPPKIIL